MAAVMAEYATVAEIRAETTAARSSSNNVYRVKNVDEKGRIIHIGSLEVNEVGVIFTFEHYPCESTQWPLTCVRKYGVRSEDGVFALEVGRLASTGEGTFAFRTEDAQEICRQLDYYTSGASELQAHSSGQSWQR